MKPVKMFTTLQKMKIYNDFKYDGIKQKLLSKQNNCSLRTIQRICQEMKNKPNIYNDKVKYLILPFSNSIILTIDDNTIKIKESYIHYDNILKLLQLKNIDLDKLRSYIQKKSVFNEYIEGDILISNNQVYHVFGNKKYKISNDISDEIINLIKTNNLNYKKIIKLLDKLIKNPQLEVINNLWEFIVENKVEIGSGGNIILYKIIDKNYINLYNSSDDYDNTPGNTVEIPRYIVDKDPGKDCIDGLHLGSKKWLVSNHYICNEKHNILKISVNPKDICCIPYNNYGRVKSL